MLELTRDELQELAEDGVKLYSPTCQKFVFKVWLGLTSGNDVHVKDVDVAEAYDICLDISRNQYHEWESLLEHGTGRLTSDVYRDSSWEDWCDTYFTEEDEWYRANDVDELLEVLDEFL